MVDIIMYFIYKIKDTVYMMNINIQPKAEKSSVYCCISIISSEKVSFNIILAYWKELGIKNSEFKRQQNKMKVLSIDRH